MRNQKEMLLTAEASLQQQGLSVTCHSTISCHILARMNIRNWFKKCLFHCLNRFSVKALGYEFSDSVYLRQRDLQMIYKCFISVMTKFKIHVNTYLVQTMGKYSGFCLQGHHLCIWAKLTVINFVGFWGEMLKFIVLGFCFNKSEG